jgi:hypothetical protein
MPIISQTRDYNGFVAKAARLGLDPLVAQATSTLLSFQMLIEERRFANGTQGLRKFIDLGFEAIGGWIKIPVGGIDWSKQNNQGASVGVEVQVSGRSDLLAVDIMHLKEDLEAGKIDIGIIIVPDDPLSKYLTDRTPNFRTAIKHVEHRAKDLPIRVIAFQHDGIGPPLDKIRTNLGRFR